MKLKEILRGLQAPRNSPKRPEAPATRRGAPRIGKEACSQATYIKRKKFTRQFTPTQEHPRLVGDCLFVRLLVITSNSNFKTALRWFDTSTVFSGALQTNFECLLDIKGSKALNALLP